MNKLILVIASSVSLLMLSACHHWHHSHHYHRYSRPAMHHSNYHVPPAHRPHHVRPVRPHHHR